MGKYPHLFQLHAKFEFSEKLLTLFAVTFICTSYEFNFWIGLLKMGLSAPIEDHEVHRFATDISMKLLEEVCTKLEVTDQPLEYSTQEIVKPIVIAHKFAKLVPTDNLNARFDEQLIESPFLYSLYDCRQFKPFYIIQMIKPSEKTTSNEYKIQRKQKSHHKTVLR